MNWLRAYLSVPFSVIVFFMDSYKKNRAWLDGHLAQKRAAWALRTLVILTFLVWLAIWAFKNLLS